jgi:ATP-dependent RNA helicase SUPV3L1/SUV3
MVSTPSTPIRNVTAVLGPTNTGKTHLAIERMLDHETGVIGLPLRLLAREIYDKIAGRVGAQHVALVTGEEKIKPESPRYWVCTVEAMPQDVPVQFLAIDEIQLAADPERGHVFTERLLNARGEAETLVLGAGTMRETIADLIPGANFISRPRLSKLTYAGQKKITRLPARSAIVAFSASEVYAIAELIRRQRGGAAVVLGALSPRTRNAQVALYQSGDVDFLVATDAVGMGLNLDVDHVAFSAVRKFDGYNHRDLTPSEIGQIAGRAGRHLNDGTFGVTGDARPFEPDVIERLESHSFDPVKTLQWRNWKLDFTNIDALRDSLRALPDTPRLTRARMADDVEALENLTGDREVMDKAGTRDAVAKLWDVCQIPDYRKISSQNHAELVGTVYNFLMGASGRIDDDWFARQVEFSDRTDGDIDTLSNRLAHIRTWTFVANRPDWLKDPEHWQERARQIEDNLSDALHERLTQRFVDKRTSALMKGLKDKEGLTADIAEDGQIKVQDHFVGRLAGFRFIPDTHSDSIHGKATRHAAAQVLSRELSMRARRVAAAKNDAFKLTRQAAVIWREDEIARLTAGEDPLKPDVTLVADEQLQGADRDKVLARVKRWVEDTIGERLKPLVDIAKAEDVTGLARGIAFRLSETLGVLRRETAADEIKTLDQTARAQLRKYGLRFGAFNLFFPVLLKPASAELLLTLWCLKFASTHGLDPENLPEAPRAGLTSVPVDPAIPEAFYQVYGFHVCGPRAVRIDILERLADQIRPLLSWKPTEAQHAPPKGATGIGAFTVTPEMMSILGCSADELGEVLRSLGFRSEKVRREQVPSLSGTAARKDAVTNGDAGAPGSAEAGGAAEVAVEAADMEATHDAPGVADTAAGDQNETLPEADVPANAVAGAASADTPAETTDEAQAQGDSAAPQASAGEETAANADQATDAQAPDMQGDAVEMLDATAAIDSETPAQDAEQFIELWRPKRRNDGQRPRRRGGGGDRRRRDGRDNSSQAQEQQGNGAPARADQPAQGNAGNRSREQEGGERKHDRGRGRDKRPGGHRRGGERRRDDRQKPAVHSSSPKKKSAGADPDSPFAALSALRLAMDDKDKEPK